MSSIRQAIVLIALPLVAGCGDDQVEPLQPGEAPPITFSQLESQTLSSKCVSCHQSPNGEAGVNLDSYAALVASTKTHGHAIVEPGDPGASHLLDSVQSGDMPPEGPRLSENEIDSISQWIAQGARDN